MDKMGGRCWVRGEEGGGIVLGKYGDCVGRLGGSRMSLCGFGRHSSDG